MDPAEVQMAGLVVLVVLTGAAGFSGAIIDRRPGVFFHLGAAGMVAGALLGAVLCARLLLPPEPGPGESPNCGLMALPAMFVGLPVGFVLGAIVGWGSGLVLESVVARALKRANRVREHDEWTGPDFEV